MRISDGSSDVCSSDLTLHRTKARHLPHEPLLSLAAEARVFRKQPAALFGEIEQDRAALEHRQRRTAAYGLMVDDRGQAAVRVDPPQIGRASCRVRECQYV